MPLNENLRAGVFILSNLISTIMIQEKNLRVLDGEVSVQYNDLCGLIALDGHNNVRELFNLCREQGIDMERYFLIGFGFHDTFDCHLTQDKATCSVLLVDKNEYGTTADEIMNSTCTGIINVLKKRFTIPYVSLGHYIKRIDFMTISEVGKNIQKMNIIDEGY